MATRWQRILLGSPPRRRPVSGLAPVLVLGLFLATAPILLGVLFLLGSSLLFEIENRHRVPVSGTALEARVPRSTPGGSFQTRAGARFSAGSRSSPLLRYEYRVGNQSFLQWESRPSVRSSSPGPLPRPVEVYVEPDDPAISSLIPPAKPVDLALHGTVFVVWACGTLVVITRVGAFALGCVHGRGRVVASP